MDGGLREAHLPSHAQELGALFFAALQGQAAPWPQHGGPAAEDAAVEVQPVLPAVQGDPGLEVPDGGLQRTQLPAGHVGRVGDDQVEFPQLPGGRGQGVRLHGDAAGAEAQVPHVLPGQDQGPALEVRQHHPAARGVHRQGQADAAAAGAQIQHPGVGLFPQIAQGRFRHHLGVAAGDQHVGVHRQLQAEELPGPHDVGGGLPLQAAAQMIRRPLLEVPAGVEPQIPQELRRGLVRGGGQQDSGLLGAVRRTGGPQGPPGLQIHVVVGLHQRSAPFSSGITRVRARAAHSIMLSSGSKTVSFCRARPGAESTRLSQLSWPPAQRLIS